jgi:hypothetical protein
MKTLVGEKTENTGIDWNKPQLLEGNNGLIVQSDGRNSATTFCGFVQRGNIHHKCYKYGEDWYKPTFKAFSGSITLQND